MASSGAAPTTCLFFAVEFAGWGLASGVYSWGLAGCVWPPSYQFPCSLTLKTAPGAVFGSLEPLLEPLPTTI